MKKYLKLTEFSKEEVQEQINQGIIDNDFISDYISKITEVYNLLIDEIERLEERNKTQSKKNIKI